MDDLALLNQWCAGDRRAGEELCGRYFAELYRFFQYKIEGKADDLVQQTFMACVKAQAQFPNIVSFRGYLFAIARNELYMELRKPRRHHVDLEVSSLNELVSSPSKQLAHDQELSKLRTALGDLPVEQQLLLELCYWHDLSAPELAELFSTTAGAIRVRLLRARRALRDRLDSQAGGMLAGSEDRLWRSLSEPDSQ